MRDWPYTIRELIAAKSFTLSDEPAALVPCEQLEELCGEVDRLRALAAGSYAEEARTLTSLPYGTQLLEGDLVLVDPEGAEPDYMPSGAPWLGVVEGWAEDERAHLVRCVDLGEAKPPSWNREGKSVAYYLKGGDVRLLRRAGRKP